MKSRPGGEECLEEADPRGRGPQRSGKRVKSPHGSWPLCWGCCDPGLCPPPPPLPRPRRPCVTTGRAGARAACDCHAGRRVHGAGLWYASGVGRHGLPQLARNLPCLLAHRQLLLHPRGNFPEKRNGPSKGRSRTSWARCRFQGSSVITRRSESNNWRSSGVTCLSAACAARFVRAPAYAARRIDDLAKVAMCVRLLSSVR